MKLPKQAERLRIFTGENYKHKGRPVYEMIVEEARRRGMAGATVLRGISGYGANSRVSTSKILRLSKDLPLVVEIIDEPEKIASFLPFLDEVMPGGLVTRDEVQVIFYRANTEK